MRCKAEQILVKFIFVKRRRKDKRQIHKEMLLKKEKKKEGKSIKPKIEI